MMTIITARPDVPHYLRVSSRGVMKSKGGLSGITLLFRRSVARARISVAQVSLGYSALYSCTGDDLWNQFTNYQLP